MKNKRWVYIFKYKEDYQYNTTTGWKVQGTFSLGGADNVILRREASPQLTPVEFVDGVWFKRDDFYEVAGVRGGKARTCWALSAGAPGLVTAGSRKSPQCAIVAAIAHHLGIECRLHTPRGALSHPLLFARHLGATIIQHPAGYNSVIVARARADALALKWKYIPFGMECAEAVVQTARQVENIPQRVKRIVMPVGSGMSLAGVLTGLREYGMEIPVLGIMVGADPTLRLDLYAPGNWRSMVQIERSPLDYHTPSIPTAYNGIQLDPIYEAKTIPFLTEGDLLWIVGIRPDLPGAHHEGI